MMLLVFLAVCLIDVSGVRLSFRGLVQPVPSGIACGPAGWSA